MRIGKDIWREIGKKIVEKEKGEANWRTFWNLTLVNKEFKDKIFDENFFKRQWEEKYGDEIKRNGLQKHENTWKKTYFVSLKILQELNKYHNFTYTEGNYICQHTLLGFSYMLSLDDRMLKSIISNDFSVLKHFIKKYNDILGYYNYTAIIKNIIRFYSIDSSDLYTGQLHLRQKRLNNYIRMLDYTMEDCGSKKLGFENDSLWTAANEKCLDIVKHVAEKYPSTISHSGSEALRMACVSGDLEIVKYLVLTQKVSIISYKGKENYFLNLAVSNNHAPIAEFLKSC